MTVTDYVHLPHVPENLSKDWMEEFRKHVIIELKKSRTNLNRVDYATAEIIEDVYNLEPPDAPTFDSVLPGNCMIYVVVDTTTADVARYDLAVSTVSTRKMQYYSALAHTDTKGYFHFPCTEPVWIWARAVRVEDETFEAASGWTQYTDALGLGYVNVLTDTITGGAGDLANWTHISVAGNYDAGYGSPVKPDTIIRTGGGESTTFGYWDHTVVYSGLEGARARAQFHLGLTTAPTPYIGFLFLIPDAVMTGFAADWTGDSVYFVGLKQTAGGVFAVVGSYACDFTAAWPFTDTVMTELAVSGGRLDPTYCTAAGVGAFECRITYSGATNTLALYGGADYATELVTYTGTEMQYSTARNGIGFHRFDSSWFDDDVAMTVDAINFLPIGDDSVDPGYLDMEHGGTGADLGTGGAVGDVLIAADATSMKRLAGNTTTTKKFLSQTGDGAASADPAWDLATHVILDSTWHTDSTTGTVVRGDLITGQGATPKWTRLAKGTANQLLAMDGTATDIAWADRTHNVLSAWHGDSTTAAAVRGDIITAQGVAPLWTRLAAGTAGYLLNMGANEPQWSSAATLFGSGTDNYIPKFLVGATPTFADSIMSQTGTTAINLLCADAVTNTATDLLVLKHDSSDTPAVGFGSSVLFQLDSDTQEDRDAAELTVSWTTATDATRTSKVEIWNVYNGTLIPFLHTSGSGNLFIGNRCGNASVSGTGANVVLGELAGPDLTTGYYNVLIGRRAGERLTDGYDNFAIGAAALSQGTSAYRNFALGTQCLEACTGNNNTGVGYACGKRVTTGASNSFYSNSGQFITTGSFNCLFGRGAVNVNNVTGVTAFGYQAGNASNGNYGVFIGYYSGYYETAANKLFIDNAQRASEADGRVKALIYGIFAAANVNQYLTVNGNVIGQIESTDTNAVRTIATLRHNTTGIVANGLGTGLGFQIETSTTENTDAARISSAWVDNTHATRKANLILSVYDTALRTGLTIAATGSGAALTADGTLTVGADDAGYDVTLYGATAGKKMLWDESADTLQLDGTLVLNGGATLGDADTDAITCTGRLIVRTVNDGDMDATDGTTAEVVFNSADSKFYGCTASGTPATWAALN